MRQAAVLGGALAAITAPGCLNPTQVTVELSTEVDCPTVERNKVAIVVGVPGRIEDKDPSAVTGNCDPQGAEHRVGSLTIVPRDDDNAEFGIKAVVGVDRETAACLAPDYAGCIVTRRTLNFLPHTDLHLPIVLRLACKDRPCGPLDTCVRGLCRPAVVDVGSCALLSACGEGSLGEGNPPPDAGVEPPDAGVEDAGPPDAPPVWTVIDTLTVPVNGSTVFSGVSLQAGVLYRLRASGTFVTNPTNSWDADAEYFDFVNAPGSVQDTVSTVDVGLAIDDPIVDANRSPRWGAYQPSHVYEIDFPGKGAPIVAQYHDGNPGNNSGTLKLEILALQ